MIPMGVDGLTRRRGARIAEEREKQRNAQQATAKQPLSDTVLPLPIMAVVMSGAIFLLASIFMVWYHVYYDDD